MSEQDNVTDDTQNVTADDTNVSDTDTNDNTDDSAHDSDDVDKLKEQNKRLFERAKKAEAEAKELKLKTKAPAQAQAQQPAVKDDTLSPRDLYALMDAKIPQADIDEVVRAAKLLGKSVPEALNDGLVKARLKDLAEQRDTANATNTSGSKRTTAKLTDEGLVEKAMRGGDVDPEALAVARINLKKASKK